MFSEPQLILYNAHVLTLTSATDAGTAQALAIRGNQIVAVGSDAEILALAGAHARTVDLRGRTLLPGFTDTHAHMDREGLRHAYPNLRDCRSIADVQAKIGELAAARGKGEWIVIEPFGTPPYHMDGASLLREGRYPDRFELDAAAPDNPVWIRCIWGLWSHQPPYVHVLNTAALHVLHIDAQTAAPATTVTIERDERGLTGRILESFHWPAAEYTILRDAPRFTRAIRETGLKTALALSLAAGTTATYEGHGVAREVVEVYKDLDDRGELNVRAYLPVSLPPWSSLAEFERMLVEWFPLARGRGFSNGRLAIGGIFLACGGFPEQAALYVEAWPYTGWAGFRDQYNSPAEYRELCRIAAKHRFRVNTVISFAIDTVLTIWEDVHREYPIDDLRWVLVHGQMMDPQRDFPRIKRLGAVMTTQPSSHLHRSRGAVVGDGNENHLMPHRDLIDDGIPWSLSTDNKPYQLIYTLWVAATRLALGTDRIIGAEQRVSAIEALRALTSAGAYVCFDEQRRGTLEPGKRADIIALSADPTALAPDDLKQLEVDLTIADGSIVHAARQLETYA
jgi:predicted amidohydrolase YtcJ